MKMKNLHKYILMAAFASLGAVSCAVSDDDTSNDIAYQYMRSWISLNHPDAKESGNGIWILGDTPGTGDAYNGENFIIIDYTISGMSGTISQTTVPETAKQLGTYSKTDYYGPHVFYAAEDNLPVGVEDMLKGMKVGGTREALIPLWLLGTKRYDKSSEYIKHTPKNVYTSIYKVTLRGVTDNIISWQNDSLERYSAKMYGGVDSLSNGFYYKQLKAPTTTTAFPKDTTVYINYIGRLLDGRVFDTSIADTAKKYDIYSASKTYSPVSIKWGEKSEELTMGSSNSSMISGFSMGLWQMKAGEKGVCFFNSNYGYSNSGQGNSIPAYAPLQFEIEMTAKP